MKSKALSNIKNKERKLHTPCHSDCKQIVYMIILESDTGASLRKLYISSREQLFVNTNHTFVCSKYDR